MPSPVKVSDRLLALAKEEALCAHRSATAQIEHWATLGRAVETIMAYSDVLALKRVGETLPILVDVPHEKAHDLLMALTQNTDREKVKARIHAAGTFIYATDPAYPGKVVEVHPDGTRIPGHLEDRQFVAVSPSQIEAGLTPKKPMLKVQEMKRRLIVEAAPETFKKQIFKDGLFEETRRRPQYEKSPIKRKRTGRSGSSTKRAH